MRVQCENGRVRVAEQRVDGYLGPDAGVEGIENGGSDREVQGAEDAGAERLIC